MRHAESGHGARRAGGADATDAWATSPVIAVDAMGGDHAPGEIVRGAVDAVRRRGIRVVLVGRRAEVTPLLREAGAERDIPVVHAEDALAMAEGALASWRRPRSSVAVACRLIRTGAAEALVSAGSTGGVVATSTVRLRTLPGVLRPALAVDLPTRPHPTVLLDAGANADAKPEMLAQYAGLGAAYAATAHGVDPVRVGLLTIGAEPGKGNKLTRKAAELLAALASETPTFEYRGNIEGHDLFTGAVDVAVTDGFTGNVALKSVEGTVAFLFGQLRDASTNGLRNRIGGWLSRGALREVRDRLTGDNAAGGVLLGLNGTVIVAHGASHAEDIERACSRAATLVRGQIADTVRRNVPTGRSALRPPRGQQ
ncbi:phosphate acyltransferase PlsX [Spiractinospora alimapuensis]|uniref:phosphate acyltransferase PlsX n=1 Tax=Spiractinospora alimapuensis TaxID=2820884 RepID=UPI0022AA3E74|nr:phosphate acyltransferase PlsX [Spiractinospora alimapuensis]QVQ50675.1 phosphate acyltransferase PlsX [Spiractinospora alimapuensis]